MKNHDRVKLFLRLAQCALLTAILFVTASAGFAQAQTPPNPTTQDAKKAQQKAAPPDNNVEVKQIPATAIPL